VDRHTAGETRFSKRADRIVLGFRWWNFRFPYKLRVSTWCRKPQHAVHYEGERSVPLLQPKGDGY